MYEDKTFEAILTEAKKEAGTGVQMGEGYLLYNALAALSYEIQKLYIQLNYLYEQSHADTADLDELVKIAKDRGIIGTIDIPALLNFAVDKSHSSHVIQIPKHSARMQPQLPNQILATFGRMHHSLEHGHPIRTGQ